MTLFLMVLSFICGAVCYNLYYAPAIMEYNKVRAKVTELEERIEEVKDKINNAKKDL